MSNSKPPSSSSSSSDRVMDLMLQAAITAVVAVGVNKFMKTNPPQSPEELPAAPPPDNRPQHPRPSLSPSPRLRLVPF